MELIIVNGKVAGNSETHFNYLKWFLKILW